MQAKEKGQSDADFAYTIAAARRSAQRRLLNFVRMADYMVCDTLHTVLMESVREVLAATRPPPPPEPSAWPSAKVEDVEGAEEGGEDNVPLQSR